MIILVYTISAYFKAESNFPEVTDCLKKTKLQYNNTIRYKNHHKILFVTYIFSLSIVSNEYGVPENEF